MAEDWAKDVKKYAPDADDTVIAGIVRYCGIALQNRDSSLVSFADPVETGRVRDNFLKKKLGLTQADDVLDQAIAAVGERMKGVSFKNRVTVYYLLAERLGVLHLFGGKAAAGAAGTAGAVGAGAAALGVAGLAAVANGEDARAAPAPSPANAPDPVARTAAPTASQTLTGGYGAPKTASKSGFGWWPWLLLGLLVLAVLWWLFLRNPAPPATESVAGPEVASSAAPAAAPVAVPGGLGALSAAPAEGTVTIPTGAGVTAETRDGKPVVKVYFDTGKTDLAPAFTDAATGLKDYLASHAGSTLAVSGFNDKTGDVAANAELSKNRAQAVKAALVAAGVPDASVELVKPADTTDASGSNAAARRVEVVVR